MLSFNDARWNTLSGGYRIRYDPRPALIQLARAATQPSWDELWENLHHQGDVGEASYASVPNLVGIHIENNLRDWRTYSLVACIENARTANATNPPIPEWLTEYYTDAWSKLTAQALVEFKDADKELAAAILGFLAMTKGLNSIARYALDMDEDERQDALRKWRDT
jgi:hypothetical protein